MKNATRPLSMLAACLALAFGPACTDTAGLDAGLTPRDASADADADADGSDAGPPDAASARDSGPTDAVALVDAGFEDAGALDAGAPDAGADASTDAGIEDAGAPDAGASDAGPPDTGAPPDAGTPCTDRARFLAQATAADREAFVDCDLTLTSTDTVTKRLIFEGGAASGHRLTCNGAHLDGAAGTVNAGRDMIEVRSRKHQVGGVDTWEPATDVRIEGCEVTGSVRVWGMGKNGQGADLFDLSRTAGYVASVRANAPRGIVFDQVRIDGTGRIPLYLAPGVTEVTVRDSVIAGQTSATAVYLDAESAKNRFLYNQIQSQTQRRELIAIDGSSKNLFIGNRFSSLSNGGIYLYRNCGEGGVIRHTPPHNNQIVGNRFYYNQYLGLRPAVYLGSRNLLPGVSFCDEDEGFPFGSSAFNLDYASHNVVMDNQVRVRDVADMLRVGTALFDSHANWPNYLDHNQTVANLQARPAACFLPTVYSQDLLLDGDSIEAIDPETGRCSVTTCQDGLLSLGASCSAIPVSFECQATGAGARCAQTAACPAGTAPIAATAVCNLDSTTAPPPSALFGARVGAAIVLDAPDSSYTGSCRLGDADAPFALHIARGDPTTAVNFGCEARSGAAGCGIRGRLHCR